MENDINVTAKVFGGSTGAHTAKRPRNSNRKRRKKKNPRKWLIAIVCVLVIGVAGYLTAVYSQIPFIRDLREMYIETAMTTLSHQWLATAFIPKGVVDDVMDRYNQALQDNMTPESKLPPVQTETKPSTPVTPPPSTPAGPNTSEPSAPLEPVDPDPTGIEAMLELFPELDRETIPEDIEDFHDLQIKDIVDMGIKTTEGDDVWAIDVPNKLIILYFKNSDYTGKLAIVRDSTRVKLSVNEKSGRGSTINEHCEKEGAVLGVNASGFVDPDGVGRGNEPVGLVISEGKVLNKSEGGTYQTCALDYDGNLRLGYKLNQDELRYAMEFMPIVVLNGELCTAKSFRSQQPRTVVGQTVDKSMLLLIIEGRGVTTGLGASVETCGKILLKYGCYNAMNMDGGSSSSMTYMGEMITKSSSPMKYGRYTPNAWVVLPPSDEDDSDITVVSTVKDDG